MREICFYQWAFCAEAMIKYCQQLPGEKLYLVNYRDLISNPFEEIEKILEFMGIEADGQVLQACENMTLASSLSKPYPLKWKDLHPKDIEALMPRIEEINRRLLEELKIYKNFWSGT